MSTVTIPTALESGHPAEAIRWAAEQFGTESLVVTASFEDAVLVHLAATAVPGIEVVLIDRPGQPFLGTGEASQGPTGAALANAVFDGTDALMLSAETAIGADPALVVRTMNRIAGRAEQEASYRQWASRLGRVQRQAWPDGPDRITMAITHAAGMAVEDVDAAAVVCCTRSGRTARAMARFRPSALLIGVSPDPRTVRFSMPRPFAPFLAAVEVPILPRHVLGSSLADGSFGRRWGIDAKPSELVGTGPFRFAEWKHGQYVYLARNEHYWKPGQPGMDGIYVIDPHSGKLLDFLPVPRDEVTNCAFGGDDLKTLYITGGGTLYSIRTTTPGRVLWPR